MQVQETILSLLLGKQRMERKRNIHTFDGHLSTAPFLSSTRRNCWFSPDIYRRAVSDRWHFRRLIRLFSIDFFPSHGLGIIPLKRETDSPFPLVELLPVIALCKPLILQ